MVTMRLRTEMALCVMINALLVQSAVYTPGNAPVYNPNGAVDAILPTQVNNPGYLVTQTVYGFLDFTTTIGNTVMIFSPQSAAAAVTEPPKTTTTPAPPVIETSPPTTTTTTTEAAPEEIKPSRTVVLPAVQPKEKVSVVQVLPESPKFVPKVVTPKVLVKPIGKPKPKVAIVEVTPVKEEEPLKVQVIKPSAPIIKVIGEKVEVTTTEKEVVVTPEPVVEEEEEEEVEEQDETHEEEEVEEVKEEEKEEPAQEEEEEQKEEEVEPEIEEKEEEKKAVGEPTIDAEQKEHSPIVFSSITEENEAEHEAEEEEEHQEEEEEDGEPAPVLQIGNNIAPEPEYDFLSRQPSEFVEETYRVVNLKPTAAASSPATASAAPTKAKAKRGQGNVAAVAAQKAAAPGPKINPSQTLRILKTAAPNPNKTPRYNAELASIITPSPSSAQALEDTGLPLENLFAAQPNSNLVRPSRRLAGPGAANINGGAGSNSFKNRLKNRIGKEDSNDLQERSDQTAVDEPVGPPSPPPSFGNGKKTNRYRNTQTQTAKANGAAKNTRYNRYSSSSVELATVSVFSEPASSTPAYANRRHHKQQQGSRINFKPSSSYSSPNGQSQRESSSSSSSSPPSRQSQPEADRRSFKPNLRPTPPEGSDSTTSTSLYKFKLNRSPGRWQYKSPPKPTVNIRKQTGAATKAKDPVENLTSAPISDASVQYNELTQNGADHAEKVVDTDVDLDQSGSVNGNVLNDAENDNQIERRYPIETVKVEISTPADFKDTYYEIATIKSPYTFQVGSIKNTRYITVTSTFEKTLEQETATITPSLTEPLTENILATTSHIDKESNLLDSSIATLPAITLSGDTETPPLETLTETFSTTQEMLKTHILPVIRDGTDTTSYTLIQTYHVTRLVTATKTLPPMELYQFVPSRTLNEFNSRLDEAGSELHLELEFGDENDEDEEKVRRERLPSDLDLSNIGSDFDLSEVDKTNIPEKIRPKKKVSSHKEANKITTEAPVTTPNLTPDQLQQLALLRLLNPAAAAQIPSVITSSKPIVKLETVFESHVLPIINGANTKFSTISRPIGTITKTSYEVVTTTLPSLPIPPIPQLNPFQLPSQQVQLQSTPVVTHTVVTETNSKILKLTFGAKTAYTTLYSTTVVPTQLTTYLTQSVQVQPTAAAFPGYFPAPYAPFPYVG